MSKPQLDAYMCHWNPDGLELADVHYWTMFGRIRNFVRGYGCDPDTLQVSLYPAECSYSGDVVWTWWAWPTCIEDETEDSRTNYYREGRGFEFYGIGGDSE